MLLHICDPRTPVEQVDALESDLYDVMKRSEPLVDFSLKIIASDEPAQAILSMAASYDLVILRSMRRRTAGGLAVSDVTTQVIKELTCSVILFGEPHS
jgi:nucleotide-binding universal stress UspA family protein